jgi:hypothetical protein
MSTKDSKERAQARKLQAKQIRREAYLAAKERAAKDPKVIAMKEAMKTKRREAYQQAKEKAKADRKVVASAEKAERAETRSGSRVQADDALRKLVKKGGSVLGAIRPSNPRSPEDLAPTDVRVTVIRKTDDDPYGPN